MAEIDFTHYTGTDVYNDGDTEEILLDFYSGNLQQPTESDEFFYLTTHIRENILNWYPFSKNDEVLEIGCGCGVLTDMLCRKCASVYSVEGSKRRAQITFERNKSHKNLIVYAGEFGKFSLAKKFDYVILIGVFEYAKRFFEDCADPAREFLKEIKAVLKPTGKVLLAIENRYGLKYWAGADEDHLQKPYVGFNDYRKYDVQTYGKQELISLCLEQGWDNYKFHYPFPDYKLPEVIYSEECFPDREDIHLLPIYLYGSHATFNIRETYQGLRDNGQFGFFSNSFLLECGTKECSLSDVIYAKELSYRNAPYRTITLKKSGTSFIKKAATEKAFQHLQRIHENHNRIAQSGIKIASTKLTKTHELWIEFIDGQKLSDKLYKYVCSRDNVNIEKWFFKLQEYYRRMSITEAFRCPATQDLLSLYPEKTDILKISIIDGNAANILVDKNDQFILIDQEWICEKQLPADYLMYYSILHICNICNISTESYLEQFEITKKKMDVFNKITETYYQSNKVIDSSLLKRQHDLTWNEIGAEIGESLIGIRPVCYYDTGFGFNETQKLYGDYRNMGEYWISSFQVPENSLTVRIDPALCGEKCFYYTTILINDKPAVCREFNIVTWNEKKMLTQRNPYVVLEHTETVFEIKIDLKQLSIAEIEGYLHFSNDQKIIR